MAKRKALQRTRPKGRAHKRVKRRENHAKESARKHQLKSVPPADPARQRAARLGLRGRVKRRAERALRNAPKFAESNKSAVGLALHLEEEQNDHIRMVIGMVAVWVLQRCHSTREPASESEGAMDAKCGGTPLIWPTTAQLLVLLDDVGDCYGDEEYPTKAQLHDTLRTTVDEGYIKKSNVQSPPSHHRLCIIGLETPEALCEFLFYLRGVCRRRRTSVAFTTGTAIVSRLSWGDGGEEFPSEARAIDRLEVDCVSDDLWDDGE